MPGLRVGEGLQNLAGAQSMAIKVTLRWRRERDRLNAVDDLLCIVVAAKLQFETGEVI
jgi:hypothetical protein